MKSVIIIRYAVRWMFPSGVQMFFLEVRPESRRQLPRNITRRGIFMNLKLFEVAGTHIFSMSAIVMVLFFVFAIIVVGYLLGKINIKGVSLGTAAIFLVALVVGHFKGVAFGENGIAAWIADVEAQDAVNFYFKLIQSFGLILFVTSVGLIAEIGRAHV